MTIRNKHFTYIGYFFKAIKLLFTNPSKFFCVLLGTRIGCIVPDSIYLKRLFKKKLKYSLNLKNPKTFNEKLQWLKLNDRNPLYTQLVDKYEVRNFVKEKVGAKYLIPILGVWKNSKDIDFNKLPNQFVLKCTHDSGSVVICRDKSNFDKKNAKTILNKGLKRNFYYAGREWPYKNVKPRIIAEKYMVDESGRELKDYKFMCFNGKAKCSFVCSNRNLPNGLNVDFYDRNWKPMPFERHYSRSGTLIPKPKKFDKMVEFAEKLSKDMPFVRVDFYETNGHLFFGELTFYPGAGFEEFSPESYDYLLGSWIELPNESK